MLDKFFISYEIFQSWLRSTVRLLEVFLVDLSPVILSTKLIENPKFL